MPLATYQLVLQFSAHTLEDYDQLISLETLLLKQLDRVAKVDGHDMGKGEFNIFILTRIPATAFAQAKE